MKWQRLGPYKKFAGMIDRHWAGIAAYRRPENKVALGFVEGLDNKVRVLQRRAYGLRDEGSRSSRACSPSCDRPRPSWPLKYTYMFVKSLPRLDEDPF